MALPVGNHNMSPMQAQELFNGADKNTGGRFRRVKEGSAEWKGPLVGTLVVRNNANGSYHTGVFGFKPVRDLTPTERGVYDRHGLRPVGVFSADGDGVHWTSRDEWLDKSKIGEKGVRMYIDRSFSEVPGMKSTFSDKTRWPDGTPAQKRRKSQAKPRG